MQWEYKTEKFANGFFKRSVDERKLEESFNSFGLVGWELISVLVAENTHEMIAVFKRPLASGRSSLTPAE